MLESFFRSGAHLANDGDRPDDMISGGVELDKDGWIGVFNLSTRWSMKKVCLKLHLLLSGLTNFGSPDQKARH